MRQVFRLLQIFHQETNLFQNFLEVSSHLLQTLLVLLSRSLKRMAKLLNRQRLHQTNPMGIDFIGFIRKGKLPYYY